jgi:hypothetical protein
MTPNAIDIRSANIATATTVAEPRSPARFASGHRLCRDAQGQPQRRARADTCDHVVPVAPKFQMCARGPDPARRVHRGALVTPGGQSRRLPCRIDATQLDSHRRRTGQSSDQHHRQRRDRERCLDRGATGSSAQTLVLSALVMMFVNAVTMESPVTTLYKIAPKAAAAMVPIAYSTVDIPDSSTHNSSSRPRNRRNVFPIIVVPPHVASCDPRTVRGSTAKRSRHAHVQHVTRQSHHDRDDAKA